MNLRPRQAELLGGVILMDSYDSTQYGDVANSVSDLYGSRLPDARHVQIMELCIAFYGNRFSARCANRGWQAFD